ncbi:MAG: hypothetical protein ACM3X3_02925 [Betaproteobacteria bacterium]
MPRQRRTRERFHPVIPFSFASVSGTFVTRPQSAGTEVPLRSFQEETRVRGLMPGSKLLTKQVIHADGELA